MKDWNWLARRRKLSLENFLRGVDSIEAALAIFAKSDIVPPNRETLERFFNENTPTFTAQTKSVEEKKRPASPARKNNKKSAKDKKTPTKYDDIVIIETEDV